MGVGYSNSLNHFQNEVDTKFLRPMETTVASQKQLADCSFEERSRKVLFTYPSLLLLNFMDGMSIDLGHLAVLFVLDGDKDGLFSWQDIASFVEWVHKTIPTDEKDLGNAFSEAVHARCVLQMWRECSNLSSAYLSSQRDEDELSGEGRSNGHADVVSAMSSPGLDPLVPERSMSAVSRSQDLGSSTVDTSGDREVFEEWFERFLSKNFPFPSDSAHQITPVSADAALRGGGQSTSDTRGGARRSSLSSWAGVSSYNSLVVDAAGLESIAVSEMSPLELRQQPKSFSLGALSAAHVLMAVEENCGMDLRSFCSTLIGEENLRRQGRSVACPSQALRAFNSAFVEGYWTCLRRFDLQPLL